MNRNHDGPNCKRVPGSTSVFLHGLVIILALLAMTLNVNAASGPGTPAADNSQYNAGKSSFRKRCARCHGVNMVNPGVGVFDLRTFPGDDKARFVRAVTYGKNAMPSWQDVLTPADIDVLWIYVSTGPNGFDNLTSRDLNN